MYNNYRGVYMSKNKKKKKVNLGVRIIGIIMLLLMVLSPVVGIISYIVK